MSLPTHIKEMQKDVRVIIHGYETPVSVGVETTFGQATQQALKNIKAKRKDLALDQYMFTINGDIAYTKDARVRDFIKEGDLIFIHYKARQG